MKSWMLPQMFNPPISKHWLIPLPKMNHSEKIIHPISNISKPNCAGMQPRKRGSEMNDAEWAAGIPKSPHSQLICSWKLSPEAQATLEKYYILRWGTEYFWEQYTQGKGIIQHQGVSYSVIFHGGKLPGKASQVFLSFRKPPGFPTGYVLINPARALS